MPSPIPQPVREAVLRLSQQGYEVSQIAEALDVPVSTVYRLLQRVRLGGPQALATEYRPATSAPPADVLNAALALRRAHPTWGAVLIRIHLLEQIPDRPIPTDRTLQRWFLQFDLTAAPSGRRPRVSKARAATPHDTWQMDAKEHIKLKNHDEVSWLRLTDECSGAVLGTTVFPPRGLV